MPLTPVLCHRNTPVDKGTKQEVESYTAVLRRDDELSDLAAVDAEDVFHLPGENVPDDDGEVHAPRHK